MKKKWFNEAQIIQILQEHEAGLSMPELPYKHGVGESTLYTWCSKYAGITARQLPN